jgi:DNA repair protein RecN (Recombination protein N)
MLRKLAIQNYAIIDQVEIKFSDQLNIITGETGAGKSILVGALGLVLGERADTSVLQNSDKKCIVEASFSIDEKQNVKNFLTDNDLDQDEELVLRREIASSGKSRAFINDTPATLLQMKELASMLVDLHQQFDTLEVGNADFQRQVLDALAGNNEVLLSYQVTYKDWKQKQNQLNDLLQQKDTFQKELDYHQFMFNELEEANLSENELENLDQELNLLSNSEAIKQALTQVSYGLQEGEQPMLQQLKVLANQIGSFTDYHASLPALVERMLSAQIELQDIADEIEGLNTHIQFDQQRIEEVNERMAVGYKLLKKHGVQTTNELLVIKEDLENKLQAVLQIDDSISATQKAVEQLHKEATEKAAKISDKRKKEIKPFEQKVNALLKQVGMPNAMIKVSIELASLHGFGSDIIEFLFDANKSGRFEPVRKVASGGELSRLMLCIKSLVAQSIDLPTLIYDEIDSGISGEAAKQVGIIMKDLSANRQIISITHQPQIAGKANAHFFVYKEIKGDAIKTSIRLLSQDERITSIAQMLSGEKPTAAALENAREMVMN